MAIKMIVFALGFAFSQDGIVARTPTRMQGSEVKEGKEITAKIPYCVTFHRNRSESNPYTKIGSRMPLPLHYLELALRVSKCCI